MKKMIWMATAAAAAVSLARAQQPAGQGIEDVVQVYEQRVAQQQDRVDTVVQKLKATDEAIERRVERVAGYVTRVTDSAESKTRVTRAKQDLFDSVIKNIEFYANERGRRFAELYRPHTRTAKEALVADVAWLNDRIEKRVDQALALVTSLPVAKEVVKSTTTYGDGAKVVRVNPEYTQQRRVSGRGGQLRDEACDRLKAGIERLKRSHAELERALAYAKTDEARAFVREQLERNAGLVEKRVAQAEAARTGANPAARELGGKAAEALADQIDGERADNRKDFAEWTRLKNERDTERARLIALQDRLAALRGAPVVAKP